MVRRGFAGLAGLALIAALIPVGLGAQGEAQSLGSVTLNRRVFANGQALAAGTYTLRLTTESAAPAVGLPAGSERWIEFVQGNEVRGRELASVVPADEVSDVAETAAPGRGAIRVDLLRGGEYLRIWVNQGGTHYLVHLSTSN